MRYASAAALRAALDTRLVQEANSTGTNIGRLRRRVVFERLLVRFAAAGQGRWILKGGMAVEVRLSDRARATRDIDLSLKDVVSPAPQSAEVAGIRDLLVEALLSDPEQDFFEFRIDGFRAMSVDGAAGPVWRASLDCRLDGRTFDRVVADIIDDGSEMDRVELLRLPGTLAFAGHPPVEILAIDLNLHFAEKLHAMARQYGDRPSTRVKDLVDLMLFIESGFQPTSALRQAVDETFISRSAVPPLEIPDPPEGWEPRYEELAHDLRLPWTTIPTAMRSLREFWAQTRLSEEQR